MHCWQSCARYDDRPSDAPRRLAPGTVAERSPSHHREFPLSKYFQSAPDRDDVAVSALAAELNTSSRTILDYAIWMRLAVDALDRTMTAGDADRLRDLYAITGGTPPSAEPAEPIPGFLAGPVVTEYDPMISTIEHMLNVPWRKRQGARNRTRPQHQPRTHEPELTGTAAAARRHWPAMPAEEAQRIAATWTGRYLFTDAQAAAWWKAGLLYSEVHLAHVLAELRVEPWMIKLEINNDTVLYKLRNGLAPEHAAALLRRAGHLKAG